MQRSISRRDFGKRLAGGAALLALQSAWNRPAAGQSLRNDLKDISGELSFDDAVLQALYMRGRSFCVCRKARRRSRGYASSLSISRRDQRGCTSLLVSSPSKR